MNTEGMFLRIIAGKLRGRNFDTPKGGKTVRPISDRVKEALFDILAPRLSQAKVLDLFSGTGAIGFEALSRGGDSVIYLEHDHRNITLIRNNAIKLGLENQIRAICGEMPQDLRKIRGKFSLIFMDPPFASDVAQDLFPIIAENGLLEQDGVIVLQRDRRSKEILPKEFSMDRKHRVGDSMLFFYSHVKKEDES